MRKHRYRTRTHRRRRSRLGSGNWGPILALTATVLGVLGVLALIAFVALPRLLPLVGIEYRLPWEPEPTPSPTPRPTPTPDVMDSFDPIEAATEVIFDNATEYTWFADPYFYGDKLLFSAGQLIDNQAVLNTLFLLDTVSGDREAEKLPYKTQNTHFMSAKMNERWLVYLDANANGGGKLMVSNIENGYGTPKLVKDIYTGQPEIMLSGDYIAFTDRTGSRMDKLFVCDLNTLETTTLVMFSSSIYGQSKPSLFGDMIAWAEADSNQSGEGGEMGAIHYIYLSESTVHTYSAGTYVHDPAVNGRYAAWMTDHHSENTKLYGAVDFGRPFEIADGVVDYWMGSDFVAYEKAEGVWIYAFDAAKTYRVSPERELTQLLGVNDDAVIWMDVTTRERDVMKYARIP